MSVYSNCRMIGIALCSRLLVKLSRPAQVRLTSSSLADPSDLRLATRNVKRDVDDTLYRVDRIEL